MHDYKFRLADNQDIPRLAEIYSICFGDEEDYINFFYEKSFSITDTFVIESENNIVSMMTAFPVVMQKNSKAYEGIYLYLVSTLPELRGSGLIRKLEDFVCEYYRDKGKDFICLVPGSEALIKMYEKLLYEVKFYLGHVTIEKSNSREDDEDFEISKLNKNDFLQLREDFLKEFACYVKFDEHATNYMYEETVFDGYEILSVKNEFNKGYIICKKFGNELYIKESSINYMSLNSIKNTLFDRFMVDKLQIRSRQNLCEDMQIKPYAMIKMLNDNIDVTQNCYINLMLD